jgi:tRNA/rRNA methyltransferase
MIPTPFAQRAVVVLCRPEGPENIGLAARAMINTGFAELRLVLREPPGPAARITAVHAGTVLDRARLFPDLAAAVADLHLVFAGTAKRRKNFEVLGFDEAVERMLAAPPSARVGLLFGNERTGLTSEELAHSNFRFAIPQASAQPSYNLAAAVLLTLFALFRRSGPPSARRPLREPRPLPRREQERFLGLIVEHLDARGFFHSANKVHMQERLSDLFGRLVLTEEDRRLLLALMIKESNHERERHPRQLPGRL